MSAVPSSGPTKPPSRPSGSTLNGIGSGSGSESGARATSGGSRPPSARRKDAPGAGSSSGSQWSHVGYQRTTIPPEATFDADDEHIKRDLLGMIVQYLQHEGLALSSATVQDEANVKLLEKQQDRDALRRMSKAILEGDWDVVAKLIAKNLKKFHSQQGFLYAICKQEYLELIDRQEYQKAFTFLTTHLKPLEKIATMTNRSEFRDLCYLLTCKSVAEVDAFRDWEGVVLSREKLVEQLRSTFELDELVSSATALQAQRTMDHTMVDAERSSFEHWPGQRLVQLLHQAVAYQMEFSRYHPKTVPKVTSLLHDYECEVLPNCVKTTYIGHAQNVKYVTFVGKEGEFLASGSSDTSIRLWPVELPPPALRDESTGQQLDHHEQGGAIDEVLATSSRELKGHASRIWYLSANEAGDRLYSASGDGTVKIWNIHDALADLNREMHEGEEDVTSSVIRSALPATGEEIQDVYVPGSECIATFGMGQSGGDLYAVNLHPSEAHLVTGGYDQTVRLYDVQTGANIKTFRGHVASVCDAQFNRHANLLLSGSKDGTIRLWDILSGLCVHTLRQTLGEVTSLAMASNGVLLLSGSRNNSNRLWDLRMLNAPRAQLATPSGLNGSTPSLGGGSGSLRSLGVQSLEHKPIQRFKGHQNIAKNIVRAAFGPREAFVLGGSEDGAVYVWDVDTGKLLEKLAGHHGVTYNAKWHDRQALMASSSHDGTVKTWWWQDKKR